MSDSIIESVKEKMSETFNDSDNENHNKFSVDNIYRLFGRQKPVHTVFGGGKAADIFLWRDKKVTGGVVGVATAIWVLFELLEYHLLTLVCHLLMLGLLVIFLWSRGSAFLKKSPPRIPEIVLPEDIVLKIAAAFRIEINRGFFVLREIASGKDLKKFLGAIAGLWIISVLGSSFNFLTLFYLSFLLLHTVPVLYEKYDEKIDALAEKAEAEIKKQYAVFEVKVLSKIPLGPLKGKLA